MSIFDDIKNGDISNDGSNLLHDVVDEVKTEEKPLWYKVLKSKTGKGGVDDYTGHPLNWDNSYTTARIIRGLTGMMGSLDYAIVDVAIGIIQKLTAIKRVNTKNAKQYPISSDEEYPEDKDSGYYE